MPLDATTYEVDPTTITDPRERLVYLRDFLRRLPRERFDMREWVHEDVCGTVCCIGGTADTLFDSVCAPKEGYDWDATAARLGIPEERAWGLFFPADRFMADGAPAWSATPTDAADVLTHLLNTGEVDWSVARKASA